jgi:glycine/sarcosine N-methyltransferase
MPDTVQTFYDTLAPHYHLLFEDWQASIERQSRALNRLLPAAPQTILDCACGIGTQSIAFALAGPPPPTSAPPPYNAQKAKHFLAT